MEYINVKDSDLKQCEDISIGNIVIVKNGNGNYYTGKIASIPRWHDCILSYKGERRFGVLVDYDDIVLITDRSKLMVKK